MNSKSDTNLSKLARSNLESTNKTDSGFVSVNTLRAEFSRKLSLMYQTEVPLYSELLSLVAEVNKSSLQNNTALLSQLSATGEIERLDIERHGAIRVGTAEELHWLKRLFSLFGMQPVGYYDLATAGVPVHSTAFRAVSLEDLNVSPFRIFTSLLRLDLIKNEALRQQAETILAKRNIFSTELILLIKQAESTGGISEADSARFIDLTVDIFRWHEQATIDHATYEALHKEHRLITDVISFQGPHINHLTPRTLDIDCVQSEMPKRNIPPKATIEGPPKRNCPILLRQTSFHALEEAILFKNAEGQFEAGKHTARFGEIEQRGAALTAKGRKLYDQLLSQANQRFTKTATYENAAEYYASLADTFTEFPDNWQIMHDEELAWFYYYLSPTFETSTEYDSQKNSSKTHLTEQDKALLSAYKTFLEQQPNATENLLLNKAIELGLVLYAPIVYEDFLPVSAAGIFKSNLGDTQRVEYAADANKAEFERALGCAVQDEMALYQAEQRRSMASCIDRLKSLIY